MRWMIAVFRMNLKKTMSYRVDFWIFFLGNLFSITFVAVALWSSLYSPGDRIGGFSYEAIVLYYFLLPILNENLQLSPHVAFVADDIYSGTLSRFLIYPIPYFLYGYISNLAGSVVVIFQMFLMIAVYLAIYRHFPADAPVTVLSLAAGFLFSIFSGVLVYIWTFFLNSIAFWADNVWSLNVALRFLISLFGGALIPLGFFPSPARALLEWTPFPYLIGFPIELAMGRIGFDRVLPAAGIVLFYIVVSGALTSRLWQRGLKQYAGVGI